MIDLTEVKDGVLLPVRAQAGARRNGVRGIQNGRLKVSVTQVAERGKANDAIANVLADFFVVRKSQVELTSGATSTSKQFLIRAITPEALAQRLAEAEHL